MRRTVVLLTLSVFAGMVAAIVAGVLIVAHREAGAAPILGASAAMATFGAALVCLALWGVLDHRFAREVDRLAADLRGCAHADTSGHSGAKASRRLGDLGPAAAALCEELVNERAKRSAKIAEAAGSVVAEHGELIDLLSEIPVAILVVDNNDRVILYDRQSVHALAGLALGRSLFDYLSKADIRAALGQLDREFGRSFVLTDVMTADGARAVRARVCRLSTGRGYTVSFDVDEAEIAERPLVFDFRQSFLARHDDIEDTPLADLVFVIFDCETTGLDTRRDALVQIGAVRGTRGRCIEGERFDTLVDPGRPIPPASSRVHGITDEQVRGAPGPAEAVKGFHDFAADAVLVAHNAPFDLTFLRRLEPQSGVRFDHPVLDTVLLSAVVFGQAETHTLDAIADRLEVPLAAVDRHTALGDAVATAKVFFRLLEILNAHGIRTFGEALTAIRRHERLLRDANRDRRSA